MSVGVFTRNKRFTFVEKTAGQVGDGTPYPVLVTLDQIAEIYYRVRDASFTAGNFYIDAFGSVADMSFSGVSKPSTLVDVITTGDGAFSARGYCAISNETSPDMPLPDTDVPKFGAAYYHPSFPNLTYGTVPLAIRDIGDYEPAMWDNGYDPKTNDTMGYFWETLIDNMGVTGIGAAGGVGNYRNGFTQSFENAAEAALANLYGIFGTYDSVEGLSEANITIGDEVAFVDITGSGNPIDPGNELYIKLIFSIYLASAGGTGVLYASTDVTPWFGGSMVSAGISLKLQLANAVELSCPIYYDDLTPDITADPGYSIGGSDFVIAADTWWPYNRLAEPRAIWDSATGEFVPVGAPFAAFDLDNLDLIPLFF